LEGVAVTAEGPWDLPIQGYEVLQTTFAYPLDIVVYGDAGTTGIIRLAGRFDFVEAGQQRHSLDASGERWQDLTPVLCLRHDRVASARATESGDLTVRFESGSLIEAGPSEMYENWEVSGPGFQLIALPSGSVAVFRREAEPDGI
jgi:Family of unknown function (DUF6188)